MTSPAADYFRETAQIGPDATEHSHRAPLQKLLETLAAELRPQTGALKVLHEPPREKDIGAPDFVVINKSGAAVGCVECKSAKTTGKELDKFIGGEQLQKYETLAPTILLTNYRRFVLLREGKPAGEVAPEEKPAAADLQKLEELIKNFLRAEAQTIGDAKTLARALAARCAALRVALEERLPEDKSALRGLFQSFQGAVYRELSHEQFADALAQTLVYGFLFAKLKAPDGEILDLYNAEKHIPQNFALIREIVGFMKKLDEGGYSDVQYPAENILAVANAMDAAAIAKSMRYKKKINNDDPFVNFYEDFLAEYDPEMREARGVYYTPPEVARFIVRAADDVLRRDFGLKDGLGNSNVTALDFAAGTGTFMLEMFRQVFNGKTRAKCDFLTRGHLLKRFFGFEYLIAPYIIAHIKLSYFLADMGANLGDGDRIPVYLTNTLEIHSAQIELPYTPMLAREANLAQDIKDREILVVTGNPPYSGHAQTAGSETYKRPHKKIKGRTVSDIRDTWIGGLLRDYYKVDGEPLHEQNPGMLQDDYVKFIRFAQWKMESVEKGVVSIITNHAFLHNITFPGMRKSLLDTFDRLYFLDLHGSARRRETAPGGGKDENVFGGIQQGVAVCVFVKGKKLSKGVYHADFWGTRAEKYKRCEEQRIADIKWRKIAPAAPKYLFMPLNSGAFAAYEKHWALTDVFRLTGTGIKSHRDHFAFARDKSEMEKRTRDMRGKKLTDEEFRRRYNVPDTRDWKLPDAREKARKLKNPENKICECAYRMFDARWCLHGYETMDLPRTEIMEHMLKVGGNLGLVLPRQVNAGTTWQHLFITDKLMESSLISNKTGEMNYVFPLYLRDAKLGRDGVRENIKPEFRAWLDARYGKKYAPKTILYYIYAKLHSPKYREECADFLRLDFPRVPFPKERREFERLAKIGNALILAHLLVKIPSRKIQVGGEARPAGQNTITAAKHDAKTERLHCGDDMYFHPVSKSVYNFQIGSYRPLKKYLEDRKGREMHPQDIETVEKAAAAIEFTLKKMREIDG